MNNKGSNPLREASRGELCTSLPLIAAVRGPRKQKGRPARWDAPSDFLLDVIGGSTATGGTNPGQISPTVSRLDSA